VEVLLTSIRTYDGLFSIAPVAPMSYSLGPMQRTHPLEVTFNPQGLPPGLAASLKDHSFLSRAEIQFVNNISKPLVLPLYAYNGVLDFTWETRGTDPSEFHLTGNLKTREVRVLSDRILNFGTLPVGEAHTRRLRIMNRNPVFVAVEHIKLQGATSVLSFNVRNDKGEIVTSLTPGSAESQVVIAPHSSAFIEIRVVAAFAGEDGGWISMEPSTMGALNFSVLYEAVEGNASVEHASFSMAFPGRIATQYLRLTNNFDVPLKVLEVQSVTDPRLFSLLDPDTSLVPPHTTASIGFLRFDAARKGAVGLLSYAEDGSSYMDDGNMKALLSQVGEPMRRADLQALRRRENAWEWMESSGLTSVKAIFSVRTNVQFEVNGTADAQLVRPDLMPRHPEGEVVFPLIEVGKSSQRFIELFNPSDKTVHFALVPLGSELNEKVPVATHRMFRLGDGGLPSDVSISSSGVTTQVMVPPLGHAKLGPITYMPDRVGNHSLTAHIRNNLTLLTQVRLKGRTGWGELKFEGSSAHDGALELAWEEDGSDLGRLVGNVTAVNSGDMDVRLVDFHVNNMCSGNGFNVTLATARGEPLPRSHADPSVWRSALAGHCMLSVSTLAPRDRIRVHIVAEDLCGMLGPSGSGRNVLRLVTAVGGTKATEVTRIELRGVLPLSVRHECGRRAPRGGGEEFVRLLALLLLAMAALTSAIAGPALIFLGKGRIDGTLEATEVASDTTVANFGMEDGARVAPIATSLKRRGQDREVGHGKRADVSVDSDAPLSDALPRPRTEGGSPTGNMVASGGGVDSPESAAPDPPRGSLDRRGSGSSSESTLDLLTSSAQKEDLSPRSPIQGVKAEWPVQEGEVRGNDRVASEPVANSGARPERRGKSAKADADGKATGAAPPVPAPQSLSGANGAVGGGAAKQQSQRSASGRIVARSIGGGTDAAGKSSAKAKGGPLVTARPLSNEGAEGVRGQGAQGPSRPRETMGATVKADARDLKEHVGKGREGAGGPWGGNAGDALAPSPVAPSRPGVGGRVDGKGNGSGRDKSRVELIQGGADYETFGSPAMRSARDGGEFNLAEGYALFRELEGRSSPPDMPSPPPHSSPPSAQWLSSEDPEFHGGGSFQGAATPGGFPGIARAPGGPAPVGSLPLSMWGSDFGLGHESQRAPLFDRASNSPPEDRARDMPAAFLPTFFGARSPPSAVSPRSPGRASFVPGGSLSLDADSFSPPEGAHTVGAPVAGGDGEALTPRRQNSLAFGSAFSTFNVLFDNDPTEERWNGERRGTE